MPMVKPNPDISLAKKTGHFDLLTTAPASNFFTDKIVDNEACVFLLVRFTELRPLAACVALDSDEHVLLRQRGRDRLCLLMVNKMESNVSAYKIIVLGPLETYTFDPLLFQSLALEYSSCLSESSSKAQKE
jgi:hypothetical protein